MKAIVARAGFLTSVQDLGRTGFREFGVSSGGALDQFALRVANLLVGNEQTAAGLEITLGGLELSFANERIVAWCGGEFDVGLGTISVPAGYIAFVPANKRLKFGRAQVGCRCWLAISGGIDIAAVLGSRSTDLRAGFGGFDGHILRDGDELPLGKWQSPRAIDKEKILSWSAQAAWSHTAIADPILRITRGADWGRFNSSTLQRFTGEALAVTIDSDRMGVRLEGVELKRENNVDLISEAVAPGTIQVPPSGKPIVLLGDCQTIGGYPKIAHVIGVDLGRTAQLRGGDRVRFFEVSLADAHNLLVERERELERFRVGLSLHSDESAGRS